MKSNIELSIDELNLSGFSRREAFYVGQALERELTHLIEKKGFNTAFHQDTSLGRIEGQPLNFKESTRPEAMGKQLAESIYQSIITQNQHI